MHFILFVYIDDNLVVTIPRFKRVREVVAIFRLF